MPADSLHIATTTLDSVPSQHMQTNASDSLRTDSARYFFKAKPDTTIFVPRYTQGFEHRCPAPIQNPLTDYKEETLVIPEGIAGIPKSPTPSDNDGLFILLMFCFLLVATSLVKGRRLLEQIFSVSVNTRERSGSITGTTVSETRLRLFFQIQTFVMEGICLTFLVHYLNPDLPNFGLFAEAAVLSVVAVLYYNIQQTIYRTLGYIFTDGQTAAIWIESHITINLLLGIILFPIAFGLIYFPEFIHIGLILVSISYILTRFIFIYKGIKIFLRDIYGLLYFILYLCTLEIMPLFLIYYGIISGYNFVELKRIAL